LARNGKAGGAFTTSDAPSLLADRRREAKSKKLGSVMRSKFSYVFLIAVLCVSVLGGATLLIGHAQSAPNDYCSGYAICK
jgi:hypothetical protein